MSLQGLSTGSCAGQDKIPVTNMTVRKVTNGYIVEGYGVEQRIANTIEEALAFIRKEME